MKGRDFVEQVNKLDSLDVRNLEVTAVHFHANGTTFRVIDVKKDARGLVVYLGERLN